MKNLRKVLALVLVVATLMGMAVMTNAAFTDADKISETNKEAVEVLAALKVIEGYKDDSYQPAKVVTRAEMAKMISFILNGGKDINATYKASCTFADAKDHWAAGYIGYCATKGIINGKSETVFAPNAEVTGVEAAKMLLCALGYSAETEGLTGAAWAGNTLNLAADLDLFNRIDAEPGVGMTRELAAQLLFNGLGTEMVKYVGGSTVTVAGITFVQGGVLTATGKDLMTKASTSATATEIVDALGRPGTEWTINGTSVKVWDKAVKVGNSIKAADIYKIVGKDASKLAGDVKFFTNGVPHDVHADAWVWAIVPGLTQYELAKDSDGKYILDANGNQTQKPLDKTSAGLTSKTTTTIGQNNYRVEVFFDAYDEDLTVVLYYAPYAYISDVAVDTSKKTTTITIEKPSQKYASQASGGGDYDILWDEIVELKEDETDPEKVTGTEYYGKLTVKTADTTITKDNIGDLVCYTAAIDIDEDYTNGSKKKVVLQSVELPTVLTGESEGYTGSYATFYMGGKSYKKAQHAYTTDGFTYGEKYNLYLDKYNFVIGAEAFAAVVDTKYAYVLDTAVESATFGDKTYLAKVLFADGVEEVVETKADYAALEGEIVTYGVEKEVYTMEKAESASASAVTTKAPAVGTAIANSKSIFVVDHASAADKADYAVYTGIANVPSFTGSVKYVAKDGKVVIAFALDTKAATASGVALSQSIVLTTGSEAKQAFEKTWYNVAALIDGKVTTIKVDPATWTALGKVGKNVPLYFTEGVKDGDIYTSITASKTLAGATTIASGKFGKYADGVVTIDGTPYYTETGVPAYIYNSKSSVKKLQVTTIEKLPAGFTGYAVIDNGVITALYGTASI